MPWSMETGKCRCGPLSGSHDHGMPRSSCALLLLAACATDLPHRWTHPEFQWTTHSDFAPLLTDMMFDGERGRQIRALCRLFEVDSLRDLHVYVHDQHGA